MLIKMVKKTFIPLLTLLLVIAIMFFLFLYRDRVSELENLGYLGAFLIGMVSAATIFLPTPSILLLFALGAALNPVLVGLFSGMGGAIGELSGYIVGRSGHGIARNNKWFTRAEMWMKRWGMLTVFVFSLVPILPIDAAGLAAGVLHFPIRKFLVACFLGKTLEYVAIALFGAWGWEVLLRLVA
ncbi:YqaA family protein [Chloroflexota bacterium]